MSELVSRAVNGDDDPAEVLRLAGIRALKMSAGHIPESTKARNKKSSLKAARHQNTNYEMLKQYSSLEFNNWAASKEFFERLHLKPVMPMMRVLQTNKALHEIGRWLNGRGWICGSAALWAVSGDDCWRYCDIDIFCRSRESFDELTAELYDLDEYGYDEQSERSNVFDDSPFYKLQGGAPINLVAPVDGDDWSDVTNVLLDFDLSICAVAIADSGWAYAYSPYDIREREIGAVKIKYDRKFLKRLLKYMGRGYTPDATAFDAMLDRGTFDEPFELMNDIVGYTDNAKLREFVQSYYYYRYERENPSYDYDDFEYGRDHDDDEWY